CGWSTQAAAQRPATDSAVDGAAESGTLLGVSAATGGRTVGTMLAGLSGGASSEGTEADAPGAATVPTARAPCSDWMPATAPTAAAITSTTQRPSRAGERN